MGTFISIGFLLFGYTHFVDSSFEQVDNTFPMGWTTDDIDGARWQLVESEWARSGKQVMQLKGTASTSKERLRLYSDPIPVQSGDAVKFECWVRTNGNPRGSLHVYVEGEKNGSWAALSPIADGSQSDRWQSDEWAPHGSIAFVPDGVARIRLVCSVPLWLEVRVSWSIDDFGAELISFPEYVAGGSLAKKRLQDIYLVSPDTLSQSALGCYGNKKASTQNIDWIADNGRVYEQVTSVSSWTKPSFASIMTSLYPSQHKVQDVHYALPDEAVTLAEFLKERGYFTAAFVWAPYDGYLGPYMNFDQGFDLYFNSDDQDEVTRTLLAFLDSNAASLADMQQGGLFIWHHLLEPHTPYMNRNPALLPNTEGLLGPINVTTAVVGRALSAREAYANEADLRYFHDVYYWEANYTSDILGEVFSRFRWMGIMDTLNILFCSDHGEAFGERPYTWGHGNSYERCLRTPFIMRFPGISAINGRDEERLVSNLDIMPTLIDLAGFSIPPHCEGKSLISDSLDTQKTEHFNFSESRRHGMLTVRDTRYKLILRNASKPLDNARTDHQWTFCDGSGTYELYDLQQDPDELLDLAATLPDELDRMKTVLVAHCEKYGINCEQNSGGVKLVISDGTLEHLRALGYMGEDEPAQGTSLTDTKVGTDKGFGNLGGL